LASVLLLAGMLIVSRRRPIEEVDRMTRRLLLVGLALGCLAAPVSAQPIPEGEDTGIHFVAKLPSADGKGSGGVHKTKGVPKSFDHSGRYESLTGAIWMRIVEPRVYGPQATVEISVEHGRARAYLAEGNDRYKYVDATPGKPAKMAGDMVLLGVYRFMLEAVDGEARGVSYRIWR
jgi:hypothetical protein